MTACLTPPKEPESLEERLAKRIARKRGGVFLRADFGDMGGYDQVGRALRNLVGKGELIKIGQGIYARARKSALDGKLVPENGLDTLREALRRLVWASRRCRRAYNRLTTPAGLSRCLPAGSWESAASGYAGRSEDRL